MPEATVAVYRGDFTFNLEALDAVVLARWPARRYVEIRAGRRAESLVGQFQITADDGTPLQVDVERTGKALDLSASDSALAAGFIAAVTTLPGFPDDGSAIVAEWTDEIIALRPQTPASELLARLD